MNWKRWTRLSRHSPENGSGGVDLPAQSGGRQERSTAESSLLTRAVSTLLVAAVIAGPVALMAIAAIFLTGLSAPAQQAPVSSPESQEMAVGEFAQRFVVAWIQTDRDHTGDLDRFVKVPNVAVFPEEASFADQPAVAAVREVDADSWSVTVSVLVTGPGKRPELPVRRFFVVAVHESQGAMVAETLPGMVAPPDVAEAPELAYPQDLSAADPLWQTVEEFLTALSTGRGDITRYLTPGSAIAAIAPAPFDRVEVIGVQTTSTTELDAGPVSPPDGETLQLLVTATASRGSQQLVVQYTLTVTGRAGRWEITRLDPTPVAAPTPSTDSVDPDG